MQIMYLYLQLSCINFSQMILTRKSDTLGVLASGLCFIHCIITPVIFVVQCCAIHSVNKAPGWWRALDYFFLVVSFFAVYWSAKKTSKNWIGYSLWITWVLLLAVILNESFGLISLPEIAIYFPAFGLIFLHLYNRKYCQCDDQSCCVETEVK